MEDSSSRPSTLRRRALLLGMGAVACGPKPLPPLPPAPALSSAAELIPADLDVVVRLDLARVKAALGATVLTALAHDVLARDSAGPDPDELVVGSLLAAEQVYLAYRPSSLWTPLDRVLALQGRFEPLLRAPNGFGGATDLGRDLRYWDAKVPPATRGGVARIYALGDRVRAFVSEAELDAVERTLDGAASPRRLQPPEEGTISLAARPRLLGRLAGSGSLRELLEDAKSLTAVADLESDGVRLKLELLLASADEAEQLARAGKLVLSRALGDTKLEVTLRAESERVLLAAQLSRAQLAPLLACVWGAGSAGSAAGCSW
ncbi:MAG: hypothetical protein ABUL60_27045 [Myxococcales bacterium]